mgnify:CR=1 FL=1
MSRLLALGLVLWCLPSQVTAEEHMDATTAEEVLPSGGSAEQASDDTGWDWDSFEPMDDAPTVRQRQVKKLDTAAAADAPKGPRVGETAAPDFEGDIRPVYALFPDAPVFSVIPSVRDRDMHPCSNCHTWAKSDPTPRSLKEPHDNFSLSHGLHGKGKFWCFTCHTLEGKGGLRTLEGLPLGFNEAYVLCSQCHVQEARDWVYGAHGKRVGNWRGERQVYNCTVCHYQHRPAIKPRAPLAGPGVRQGLDRPAHWVPLDQREHGALLPDRPWLNHARVGGEGADQ